MKDGKGANKEVAHYKVKNDPVQILAKSTFPFSCFLKAIFPLHIVAVYLYSVSVL